VSEVAQKKTYYEYGPEHRVGELETKADGLQDKLMESEVKRATAETELKLLREQLVEARKSWIARLLGR